MAGYDTYLLNSGQSALPLVLQPCSRGHTGTRTEDSVALSKVLKYGMARWAKRLRVRAGGSNSFWLVTMATNQHMAAAGG